jgi:16S rRNA (guanine966-N2)-methyltransferase
MRVIAGTHGGRRLKAPETPDTRPVTDRVKESVFSSLHGLLTGARVADLFAGAGSFGIEAMSRGAVSAVFVEKGRRALDALADNLRNLGLDATVVRADVLRWVDDARHEFDIVFCDPPWPMDESTLTELLERLTVQLAEDAIVVVTRRSSDPVPQPTGYAIADDRRHGDTRIIRYMLERTP